MSTVTKLATSSTLTLGTMPRGHRISLVLITLALSGLLGWLSISHYAPSAIYALGAWRFVLLAVVSTVSMVVLHECLHALFFRLYGGKVSFGAKLSRLGPVAWATSTGHYTKRQYQVISLAPQLLTLGVLLMMAGMPSLPPAIKMALALVGIGNLCGGSADIYGLWWLRGTPDDCTIEDIKDGIAVSLAGGRRV